MTYVSERLFRLSRVEVPPGWNDTANTGKALTVNAVSMQYGS